MSIQELPVVGQDCCADLTSAPLSEERAVELAAVFKALGDPVRLRLLSMIASRAGGEVCVCELTPGFDLSQPTISHHLRLLRQAGLIDCERRGTWVYYWLLPETTDRLAALLTRPAGAFPSHSSSDRTSSTARATGSGSVAGAR
ncbi:ArsR/SmtB family transcription factor [Actinophytocola oryzae]|uniref:ArsR family transcriptional regulator n=1 Tax=Actinophytocola oryzae TaxID=502181 RepID=A0A4R7UXC3_9PSEU|nr:metalloregulator ArsR/SmtB family transcription factor [Actinophytocola oryzae]TDV39716.1 ArsR family transcriptional regulator [Actinophytocola oryzae]